MKKSKLLASVMASLAMTGTLNGCSFDPSENQEEDVYGPPMPYEEPVEDPVEEPTEEQEPTPSDDTDNRQPSPEGEN